MYNNPGQTSGLAGIQDSMLVLSAFSVNQVYYGQSLCTAEKPTPRQIEKHGFGLNTISISIYNVKIRDSEKINSFDIKKNNYI